MHNIKSIRANPALFDQLLESRGHTAASGVILDLDTARRECETTLQNINGRRNEIAKKIGKDGITDELKIEAQDLKQSVGTHEAALLEIKETLEAILGSLPNLPADEVPLGDSESDNVEVGQYGKLREFAFTPLDHADLGPPLGLNFEIASKVAGSRFAYLQGDMARLSRAISNFMLNFQTHRGYEETYTPLLVKEDALFGTGQLPKFEDDLFKTTDGRWLIPTAEVSLTNMISGQIVGSNYLQRLCALTPCFRAEAGSAGRDTRGFIRQHQFEKVEMVSICTPEQSEFEHEYMVESACMILEQLELPYRKMLLCRGDMGFSARKTYDLEVWLPGQQTYREISSISNCGDFQARRMNARFKADGAKETQFLHTLNGSGLAVGRTLVAILENYQQADGSVEIPSVLIPFMQKSTIIPR